VGVAACGDLIEYLLRAGDRGKQISPMTASTILQVGLGLGTLGFAFVIIDFILIRGLAKMYSPDYWQVEREAIGTEPEKLRPFEKRHKLYLAIMEHRFRRGGLVLLLAGALLVLVSFFT
jgi:hypothetical protein